MPRKRTVSIFRMNAQYDNVGDALIIRELISLMAESSKIVINAYKAPQDFVNDIVLGIPKENVEIVEGRGLSTIIKIALKGYCRREKMLFFFIPGSIFGERSERFASRASKELTAYYVLSKLGMRFFHFGASYSSLGPRHLQLVRRKAALLEQHRVRDAVTAAYLSENGVRCDGIIPDMSFALYRKTPSAGHKDAIAFCFRTDRGPDDAEQIEASVNAIIERQERSVPLKFISQVRRDDVFICGLHYKYKDSRQAELILSDNIEAALDSYNDVEKLYSNRLHSLLMGAYMGVKPIAIIDGATDMKIISVFDDMGMANNLVTRVQDLDETQLSSWDREKSLRFCKDIQTQLQTAAEW